MQPIPLTARQRPVGEEEQVRRQRILCEQPMIITIRGYRHALFATDLKTSSTRGTCERAEYFASTVRLPADPKRFLNSAECNSVVSFSIHSSAVEARNPFTPS